MSKYKSVGTIEINHDKLTNIRFIYNLCIKNKIDAVDFFAEDRFLHICGQSYLTGLTTYTRIELKDFKPTSLVVQKEPARVLSDKDLIDFLTLTDEPELVSIPLESKLLRFCTTTNFLKALSIFNKQLTVEVNDDNIKLLSSDMMLDFDKIKTECNLNDYALAYDGIMWEKMNVEGILVMAKAITKVNDPIFKQYITLKEDKIYTHNTSFVVETVSWRLNHNYTLPYTCIEVVKLINKNTQSKIGYKDDKLCMNIDGTMISWELRHGMQVTGNLLDLVNRNNFALAFRIEDKEWKKLEILKEYVYKDLDNDILINTTNGVIVASKNKNSALLKGDCNKGFSIKVGLDLLTIGKMLADSVKPKICIDVTGKEKLLLIVGQKLVAIPVTEIKLDESIVKNLVRLVDAPLSISYTAREDVEKQSDIKLQEQYFAPKADYEDNVDEIVKSLSENEISGLSWGEV